MSKFPNCKLLPNKLSALIFVALKDLRKVERSPKYSIAMSQTWHDGTTIFAPCMVCFAGAVMAGTCKVPLNKYATPEYFPRDTNRKFMALDSIRLGYLQSALNRLDVELPKVFTNEVEIADYTDDPAQFHKDMHQIAKELKKFGL